MEFKELKPHCRNAIAAFNMLRHCGFDADNIFLECAKTLRSDPECPSVVEPADAIFACLRFGACYENDNLPANFAINVGYVDDVATSMRELAFATNALAKGEISEETGQQCMEAFEREIGSMNGLVAALIRKKITIPNIAEKVDRATDVLDSETVAEIVESADKGKVDA